jgi:hypothetical protein
MINNQFSVRLTEEQRTQINEMYPDATQKDIFVAILDKAQNPPQPDNSDILAKIEKIELEKTELENKLMRVENSEKEKITALQNKISELETREPEKIEVEKIVEKQIKVAENQLFFTVPEPHLSLLRETAKRLKTSENKILLDMFIRYTVEQWSEWFYPFVIKSSELEGICGYSHKDIMNYLKKIEEI